MRIAQVAPLYESVPPRLYGGTERVVSYLTEALVELGHDVTLYASGDSVTSAQLRPGRPRALRLDESSDAPLADHLCLLEQVFREAGEFDIIHSHVDYPAFPILRRMNAVYVTTLHGRLDIPNLPALYREYAEQPLISVSNHQRTPLSDANWQATIHHGLPQDHYRFQERPGSYLAFLGRISPEKRVDTAIEIARRSNLPLKIAAKVDRVDHDYFQAVIKPLLNQSGVEFIGEIGEREKNEFLGDALALLFPVDWPEPFGLVMIEALACGTPVIARVRGSVPEVLQHGKTGFVFRSVEEGIRAVAQAGRLSRKTCRQVFEERFTAARMAADYLRAYRQLVRARRQSRGGLINGVEPGSRRRERPAIPIDTSNTFVGADQTPRSQRRLSPNDGSSARAPAVIRAGRRPVRRWQA